MFRCKKYQVVLIYILCRGTTFEGGRCSAARWKTRMGCTTMSAYRTMADAFEETCWISQLSARIWGHLLFEINIFILFLFFLYCLRKTLFLIKYIDCNIRGSKNLLLFTFISYSAEFTIISSQFFLIMKSPIECSHSSLFQRRELKSRYLDWISWESSHFATTCIDYWDC